MTVPAHAGHWLVNLLYAAPVVAVVALLLWDRIKGRRSRASEDRADGPAD